MVNTLGQMTHGNQVNFILQQYVEINSSMYALEQAQRCESSYYSSRT